MKDTLQQNWNLDAHAVVFALSLTACRVYDVTNWTQSTLFLWPNGSQNNNVFQGGKLRSSLIFYYSRSIQLILMRSGHPYLSLIHI